MNQVYLKNSLALVLILYKMGFGSTVLLLHLCDIFPRRKQHFTLRPPNMKQKIVIKVHVRCDKCRAKAMKIAAIADGVISVALEGEEKDKVVVTGDGVDAADLTVKLSKKIGYACLLSVEEVKPKPAETKDPEPAPTCESSCQHSSCQLYAVVYDPQPTSCTIM